MHGLYDLGKIVILTGVILLIAGAFLIVASKVGWLGKLPGDIYIKGKNVVFYFPLATCLVISIIITLLFYLLRRL